MLPRQLCAAERFQSSDGSSTTRVLQAPVRSAPNLACPAVATVRTIASIGSAATRRAIALATNPIVGSGYLPLTKGVVSGAAAGRLHDASSGHGHAVTALCCGRQRRRPRARSRSWRCDRPPQTPAGRKEASGSVGSHHDRREPISRLVSAMGREAPVHRLCRSPAAVVVGIGGFVGLCQARSPLGVLRRGTGSEEAARCAWRRSALAWAGSR